MGRMGQVMRGGVLAALVLVLAACETTGDIDYDARPPAPGSGGSFVIGSNANLGALAGNWTLSGEFARTCSLNFGLAPLGTANGALAARPAGFCNPEYSAIAGWMSVGQAVMLADASGTILAQLSPDGSDTYRGSFNGTFGSSPVTLKRGMF